MGKLTLDVQRTDGRTARLEGRPAQIAAWLVANQDRIETMGRGQLVFHCAGTRVEVIVTEGADAIPSPTIKAAP